MQALWLIAGEWFLNTRRGLNRGLVLGHQINLELARETLDEVIRTEGGDEIISLENSTVTIDRGRRRLNYSVEIISVWGEMEIAEVMNA